LLGAVLIGLALSVKYSSAPTAIFVAAVAALALVRHRVEPRAALRTAGLLVALGLSACVFWYGKNLIRFGNPFYPLYFGHGVDAATYQSAVGGIQQFGPRTFELFVRIPKQYATIAELPIYLSFFLAPLAVFVRRSRVAAWTLLGYFPLYTAYWFFLATHNTRFLVPGIAAGLIVLAVVLGNARGALAVVTVVIAAIAVFVLDSELALNRSALRSGLESKVWGPAQRYALGLMDKRTYLEGAFGCRYGALSYVQGRDPAAKVVDNWSIWYEPRLSVYEGENTFINYASRRRGPALWADLARSGFRYVYERSSSRSNMFANTDPVTIAYRNAREATNTLLIRRSRLAWQEGDCQLYELPRAPAATSP
jgi:hypothetical protein